MNKPNNFNGEKLILSILKFLKNNHMNNVDVNAYILFIYTL